MDLRGLLALGMVILGGAGAPLPAQTPTSTPAPPPAWWSASPPLIRSTDVDHDNYRPANLGQLKNFALHARAHLNDRLDGFGGAGTAIDTLVTGWTGPVANNYRPVNLGQLKAVADRFYARLDAVGFDYKAQLTAAGYPAGRWTTIPGTSYQRPWSQATAPAANYAPANLGQLKMLFSFDLAAWSPLPPGEDQDGDGIPNGTELANGSDPADYYSQGGPLIRPRIFIYAGANQFTPGGEYSARPLVFRVVNAATGEPLANAPVALAVSQGTGKLALTPGGASQAAFSVRSDPQGFAPAYFKAE